MSFSNNYSLNNSNQMNLIPFQIRFEGCLKETIVQKCNVLTQLIQESIATNFKDIQTKFIILVDDIFGIGSHAMSTDWSLKLISRNYNPREFDAIYNFLQPNGCLFQLIRQLMNDPINRYEFPKTLLPIPTKVSLEEGVIPPFYANKISHVLSNNISLNAFEYYLFRFANHMLDNSPTVYQQNPYYLEQLTNANTNPSNIVYFSLLESYLNHFVPLSSNQMVCPQNPSSQSSIWQSLSSTTSSLLHLGSTANSPSSKTVNTTPTQTSTLFKSSILNLKPLLSGSQDNQNNLQMSQRLIHDSLGSEIGKCETFLMTVTEIWLNHAIPPSLSKRNSPSKQQILTPNSDHMRAVRILVKHLHYFANSCTKRGNDSINSLDISPLDDIKRCLWSQKYMFQKKLYTFLRLSFDRWPNDTSFRLPLETWLSYIQPWRYVITSSPPRAFESEEMISMNGSKSEISLTDCRWKQFICDNLLFYSVIFRQLIPRFSRLLDLSSSKNALMLFRVTKVFSQTNLSLWIREAENSLMNSDSSAPNILQTNWSTNSRNSLLSPAIRQQNFGSLSSSMRHPLMEMEANNFQYTPLFCPAIRPLIQQLLIEISKALNVVNEMLSKSNSSEEIRNDSGLSLIKYIISLFQFSEDITLSDQNKKLLAEKSKTRNQLQMASNHLSQLFEVPTHEAELFSTQNQSFDENQTPLKQKTTELFDDRDGTPKLTSFGRSEVLNKRVKPQLNLIEGNPDTQPVRTYELYYLVQWLLFVSDWINRKYGHNIQNLYNRNGFSGVFFRQLITGPTYFVTTVRTGDSCRPPERVTQMLKPRINLRFMANKVYIFYSFIVYFVVFLLNYSLISFASLLFAMYLTYLTTKSLLIHFSSH